MNSFTVRVLGGLGNQLHCYAFGRALAAKSGALLKLDSQSGYWNDPFGRVFLLDHFPRLKVQYSRRSPEAGWARNSFRLALRLKAVYSAFLPLQLRLVVLENKPLCYKKEVHNAQFVTNPYFIGYWASFRYYREIESELKYELKPKEPTNPKAQELLSQIRAGVSCSIHWRSYREDKNTQYPDLRNYYRKAIEIIAKRFPDITFFVFSDDPVAAIKEVAMQDKKIAYVDLSSARGNEQGLIDFFLMYACDHAIIGNSTFSWWAAWLSGHQGKTVIAPKGVSPWGDDWIPPNWLACDINSSVVGGIAL